MTTTTEAFLKGQGIPIDLAKAENELTKLWGPAAQRVGGPELEKPNVTRVVLSNLLVVGRYDGLDEVLLRHPSRTIILSLTNDADPMVQAEVSAVCHLPTPGQPQVCSERIALFAGPAAREYLPAATRSMMEPDLPAVLWWSGDPLANVDLFQALASDCSRILLDFPYPGISSASLAIALDRKANPYAQDLAWFKLTPWRALVAQRFDPPDLGSASRIRSVEVHALAPQAGPVPRLAAWLAAWLAGQLKWDAVKRQRVGSNLVTAQFSDSEGHPVDVRLTSAVEPSIGSVQLAKVAIRWQSAEGTSTTGFEIVRPSPQSREVNVKVDARGFSSLPQTVIAPEINGPGRVISALESNRDDSPYRRALPHALWLIS